MSLLFSTVIIILLSSDFSSDSLGPSYSSFISTSSTVSSLCLELVSESFGKDFFFSTGIPSFSGLDFWEDPGLPVSVPLGFLVIFLAVYRGGGLVSDCLVPDLVALVVATSWFRVALLV